MAKESNSLSHLLVLWLLGLAASVHEHQVCAGLDKGRCELVNSRTVSAEEDEVEGLELVQMKGLKKMKVAQQKPADHKYVHDIVKGKLRGILLSQTDIAGPKKRPVARAHHRRGSRGGPTAPGEDLLEGDSVEEETSTEDDDMVETADVTDSTGYAEDNEQMENMQEMEESEELDQAAGMEDEVAEMGDMDFTYDTDEAITEEEEGEYEDPPFCNHYLSGVDEQALSATLNHTRIASTKASKRNLFLSRQGRDVLHALQQQKIFIAVCLHDSAGILDRWTSELVRLLMALKVEGRSENLFVSVYESGSTDLTVEYLSRLKSHLKFLGVPSKVVTSGVTRDGRERIDFLADVRNRAMEPLRASAQSFDMVFWLSDNVFCTDGVLQMLAQALPETKGGLGADAVCGMDYHYDEWGYIAQPAGQCLFYDRWVSHDIAGNNFENDKPYVRYNGSSSKKPGPGNAMLEEGEPFQVFSCWNAMVVFNADIFQEQKLQFRSHREELGECAAAETELIFRDMWTIGRGKILVSPGAASAYDERGFQLCAAGKQPQSFDRKAPVTWAAAPETSQCCPLRAGQDFVNWDDCFSERWNRFPLEKNDQNSFSEFLGEPTSLELLEAER